ncbi:MAG: TRAP transporter small permease subunit [Pyramidobacter sp.]|nr:TRAP transporter small permease subunit [Pyramidobacter sp.]
MKFLVTVNDFLEKACKKLAGWILILFTMTISVQVILRAAFSYPLSWAQDAAVMLFIWMVYLGAPVALRRWSHFIIDLFNGRDNLLSRLCDVVSDVLIFVFLYVLIVYGAEFTELVSTMYYSYIYMPQSYVVVSVPVSAVIMSLMNAENFIVDLKKLCGKTAACEGGAQ